MDEIKTTVTVSYSEGPFDAGVTRNKTFTADMLFNNSNILSISGYSIIFTLSSFLNIMFLAGLISRKRLAFSRIDLLLVHLAVADLLVIQVTFFMMPLEIGWAATVEWVAGDFACRIMSFFRIFGLYLSVFILVVLALDRYIAVVHPMKSLRSAHRAKQMLLMAWLFSALCSFPQILIFHVETHPEFPEYQQCVTFNSFSKREYELIYSMFGMVVMYILPLILLAFLYGSIVLELRRVINQSKIVVGSADGLRREGNVQTKRAKIKSVQMTFTITSVFLVCWTPYYVMCLWYWLFPQSAKDVNLIVQKGLFLFASTNVTVNPIVYRMFHPKSFSRNEKPVISRPNGNIMTLQRCSNLDNISVTIGEDFRTFGITHF